MGGSLTPQAISSILREAESGDLRRYIDVLNEFRQKDGHLQGILSLVEESIAELPWGLHLPETAKARDKRAAAWIEEVLRSCKGLGDDLSSFDDMIAHLCTSFYHGHSVAETSWAKDAQGRLISTGFYLHAARRFAYRNTDSVFIWRDETMPWAGVDIRREMPGKFLVAQPRVNGDVPCREGLGRVLLWASLFRNWTMTDWLRTAELAWKPWRIGYYSKDASKEDISTLEEVLQKLVTTGTATLADTTNFKAEWPGGNAGGGGKPTHSELHNVVAQEMSKAALGSTETVQSSTSSGYAQAKVHDKVAMRLVRSRAKQIARIITRDLIRWLAVANFGPDIMVPEFRFVIEESVDIATFGAGIEKLVKAGTKLSQDWVRGRIGAPEPKEGEEILEPHAPEPPEPEDGEGEGEGEDGDGEDTTSKPPKTGDEEDNADAAAGKGKPKE